MSVNVVSTDGREEIMHARTPTTLSIINLMLKAESLSISLASKHSLHPSGWCVVRGGVRGVRLYSANSRVCAL